MNADPRDPAGSTSSVLTLAHFGDLHLWSFGLDFDPYPKRYLGLGNLLLRRARRFPASVAAVVVERLASVEADYLLFSGDLATTALRCEFEAGRRLFEPLRRRWGDRFILIPGNHDRYTPRAASRALFERHLLESEPVDYPFARDLGEAWTLIAFDCSVPSWFSASGRLSDAMHGELERLLEKHRARGRRLAVMGHYPLLYPSSVPARSNHALAADARRTLLQILEGHGVELYLHGHYHRRWALEGGGMLHLNCGSAGMIGSIPERMAGFLTIRAGGAVRSDAPPAAEAHWLAGPPVGDRPAADWLSASVVPERPAEPL